MPLIPLGPSNAVLSGLFAALASVFGKLISSEHRYHPAFLNALWDALAKQLLDDTLHVLSICPSSSPSSAAATDPAASCVSLDAAVAALMRLVCFLLVLACNGCMWTLFTAALNQCRSSLEATAVNMAANFGFSAILGMLVFGEPLPLGWWLGMSIIVAGAMLIVRGSAGTSVDVARKKTN